MTYMRFLILFISINLTCFYAKGQEENFVEKKSKQSQQRNTLGIDILGSAGYFYNIVYERFFYISSKHKFYSGLGAQYMPNNFYCLKKNASNPQNLFTLSPRLIGYMYGLSHHIEFCISILYIYGHINYHTGFSEYAGFIHQIMPTYTLAYRYQGNSPFYIKAGVTDITFYPVDPDELKFGLLFLPEFSFGYSF